MTTTEQAAQVVFATERMTNSTELKRLLRAVESTYYLCLFSGDGYDHQPDVWKRWARIGYATGLQESPLSCESNDWLKLSTFSDGKTLTFTATLGNAEAVLTCLDVLRQIDALRPDVQSLSGTARVEALLSSGRIDRIIGCVDSRIADLADHQRQTIQGARSHALQSLTFPIITRCLITGYDA
jgi:hypothetical protein